MAKMEAAPIKEFSSYDQSYVYARNHTRVSQANWDIAQKVRIHKGMTSFWVIVVNVGAHKKYVRQDGTIR